MEETFTQMLIRFMEEREITRPELYTDACMDRKLVSKILKHKDYQPKKYTAVRLGEISSSFVREVIEKGDMEMATNLLGHPYSFTGSVKPGFKLGRKLGFPTMNLYPDKDKILPPKGVYYSEVAFEGAHYPGITNIGVRPTVSDGESVSVETYLYDFDRDMYGENIETGLLAFKRPEMKFGSKEELKKMIDADIDDGREFFGI